MLSGQTAAWFARSLHRILLKYHLFTVAGVLIPNPPCSPFLDSCSTYKASRSSNKAIFLLSTPSMQSFILNQLDRTLLNLHNYSNQFNCDGIDSNSWARIQTCRYKILRSPPQPPIPSLWACSQYLDWISFFYHFIFHFVFSSLHSWVPVCDRWEPLVLSIPTTYFI